MSFCHTSIWNSLESIVLSYLFEVAFHIIYDLLIRNDLWFFSKFFNEEDLQEVERFKKANAPTPKIQKNLKNLNFDSCRCPDNLMLLLSPSALMSITLSTCLCLTNHVFQKITEFNAFPNFRYFGVISNSGITKEGIDTLMQGSPSQSDEAFYAAPI